VDNHVMLEGNLTGDPIKRYTASGDAVLNFSVAVNRSWTDSQTRERREQVTFQDVTAWKHLAENGAATLKKGDRVVVAGRLETQTWDDNGQKRSKNVLVATTVAVSLRFATAVIAKNEKGQSAGSPAPVAAESAPADDGFDEEPF
jgi:single-strand DNA-binding protein